MFGEGEAKAQEAVYAATVELLRDELEVAGSAERLFRESVDENGDENG